MNRTETTVAAAFLSKIAQRDIEGALALTMEDASIEILPIGVKGTVGRDGKAFFEELVTAFPDLKLRPRRLFAGKDGTAVAEVTIDGTQSGEFLGVINQEKHVDLDQGWLLHVKGGRIDRIKMFWCQNMLYRRLAVKRLDRVTITA